MLACVHLYVCVVTYAAVRCLLAIPLAWLDTDLWAMIVDRCAAVGHLPHPRPRGL